LNQPTCSGHGEDRANRGAQQCNAELGIVQPQTVLNRRNARHPTAEDGTEEEEESGCRPAGLTQVSGVLGVVADGNRFDSGNARLSPFDDDATPQMASQTVAYGHVALALSTESDERNRAHSTAL
jgi:hypothetical protein